MTTKPARPWKPGDHFIAPESGWTGLDAYTMVTRPGFFALPDPRGGIAYVTLNETGDDLTVVPAR